MLQAVARRGGAAGRGGTRHEARGERQRRQWRHGRSVKTASASSSSQHSADGVQNGRASGSSAPATEQRAAHETVGMQEYLRYAGLR